MSTLTPAPARERAGAPPALPQREDGALLRFRRLAWAAAAVTYVAIVIGGIVRITGSGLGCGDDWPLCNGHLVPPLSFETFVEYGHRLKALVVTAAVLWVAWTAWRHRARAEFRPVVAPAMAAVVLLAVQIALGAITVWLELPGPATSSHLATSMLLVASLVIAAARTHGRPAPGGADRFTRAARLGASVAFAVVVLGAMVANTGLPPASPQPSAAAYACLGFPLCNGSWLPGPGLLVGLHWTHRMLAYAFALQALGLGFLALRARRGASRAWALTAVLLVVAQVTVAGIMIVQKLPDAPRALHMALGVAVWASLVATAVLAARSESPWR